jgi:CubicO group peptidase (beta-lactamase class C family)
MRTMKAVVAAGPFVSVFLLLVHPSLPAADGAGRRIAERVRRVEQGLPSRPVARREQPDAAHLLDRMAQHQVPGVSLAVINDFRVEWARGYGVREEGRPQPVTPDTLFQAGSISKPVAALAALRLVEQGLIDLDEDVNQYLRTWKVPANGGWQPRVTLRQLLSHSAGLTVHGFPGYPVGSPVPSVVQILDGLRPANTGPVRVDTMPGVQFRYSGGGTTVVQQMLEDLMDKPFPVLARELVLDPLGMTDSTYEQPLPGSRAAHAATAHPWRRQPLAGRWHIYPEMAAAGLWTTASDLARFAVELQLALAGRSRILSRSLVEQMLAPQIDRVALGFFLEGEGSHERFGHGGWDEGFVAKLTALRRDGKGAVVMINSNQGAEIIDEIERAIAAEYRWADAPPARTAGLDRSRGVAGEMTGEYELRSGLRFVVSVTNRGMFLQASGQPPAPLFAARGGTYVLRSVTAEVAFVRNGSNEVTALTFRQNGRELTARRIK